MDRGVEGKFEIRSTLIRVGLLGRTDWPQKGHRWGTNGSTREESLDLDGALIPRPQAVVVGHRPHRTLLRGKTPPPRGPVASARCTP